MLDKINADLKSAMLENDIVKVSVLRMLKSALQNQTIANKGVLTDDDILGVLAKEHKQRLEAAGLYQQGGDEVRSNTERAEAEIIAEYLPKQLSEDELRSIIDDVVGAMQTDNVGLIIGSVMKKVRGQADGSVVAKLVNQRMSQ